METDTPHNKATQNNTMKQIHNPMKQRTTQTNMQHKQTMNNIKHITKQKQNI